MSAGWTTATLGEIAQVVTGSTPSTSESSNFGGPYPFVTPTELDSIEPIRGSKTSLSEIGAKQSRVLPAGAVLVCCIGSLGKVGIAGVPLVTNQQINALILNDRYVLPAFAYHYCRTLQPMMEHVAPSTTLKIINKSRFAGFRIAFPPLAEQRRIAAILDKAEGLRAKRQKTLVDSKVVVDAYFVDLFGDPIRNLNGWDVLPLGTQIGDIRYGTGSPPEYINEGIPFIRATNVKGGTVLDDGLKFISQVDAQRIAKCRVSAGDLILVRSGVNAGDCAVVPDRLEGAYAAYDLVVRLDYPSAVFYNFLINSRWGKAILEPLTRRAAQPHLNADQVKGLLLIAPPNPLRQKFAELMGALQAVRTQQAASLARLDLLFTSLQSRAFRGEL